MLKKETKEFGEELRKRRNERGLSLVSFSRLIPCSKGHLSKVERGLVVASRGFAVLCDEALQANGALAALVDHEAPPETGISPVGAVMGLPTPPSRFVGRDDELADIADFLVGESGAAACVISGMAGVGKTALALRAAWNAVDSFPDGCFFLDMGTDQSGGTREVLDSLLRLLGVPAEQLPSRPDALANLWRSRLSGRRLLLVLDDVRSVANIAPLVTAEPGCKVVVTSRRRLNALDSAVHLPVGVLSDGEADALFHAVGGDRAVRASNHSVHAVVEHCGRLPLAVCIAAARFRSGPTRTVEELEELLSHEAYRLEMLDDGDRSVMAALTVSCAELSQEQRRLLALLTLHPGPGVALRAAAALADIDLPRVTMLLDGLASVYLVTYESSDHVTMHDLVRQFVRRILLPAVAVEEQHSAVRRLLEHSLRFAVAADKLLTPQRYRPPVVVDDFPAEPNPFGDRAAGVAWLESEWSGVVALCRTAATHGLHSLCWQLAFAWRDFFFLAKLWGPWIESHLDAVSSARCVGARAWLAISLGNLGVAHADRGDLIMAIDYYRQALKLYRDLDDEHGVINSVSNLAWAYFYLGEFEKSLDGMHAALKHYRRIGNRRNAAITLRGIALLEAELELSPTAVAHAHEAREEFDAMGLELDVVMAVNCAAWAHYRSGDREAARASYEEALILAECCGSRYETARALTGLGNVNQASGDREAAAVLWARADALYGGLEPVMLGEARVRLAC